MMATNLLKAIIIFGVLISPPTWGFQIKDQYEYIFVGEIHGTVHSPRIFYYLVESLSMQKRNIAVALEIPKSEEVILNNFIHVNEKEARNIRESMLEREFWKPASGIYDGRSSIAMLDLIDSLRSLSLLEDVDIKILCFSDATEEKMANNLISKLAEHPGYRLLVLTGNIHAMYNNPFDKLNKTIPSYFPKDKTFSIDIRANSGSAWICQSRNQCGIVQIEDNYSSHPCKNICAVPLEENEKFDLSIVLAHTEASPPATSENKNK
ncbi:hypothetical protein [Janthinobacterium sp. P210006]|uniref:hypothetical protein n=1 Tax=Janthinobacterium sp. P210006 TaxID=3112939 RepID=UPI002E2630B2|nr:hypothetical protein [Janthinobacterium sp. P210006]